MAKPPKASASPSKAAAATAQPRVAAAKPSPIKPAAAKPDLLPPDLPKPHPNKLDADDARALIESRAIAAKPDLTRPKPGTVTGTPKPADTKADPPKDAPPPPPKPPERDPLIAELLNENRKFVEVNEVAEANAKAALSAAERFRTQSEAQVDEISSLQARVKQVTDALAQAQAELAKAQADIRQLKASAAPTKDGPTVLTSESVAALIGDFVRDFDTGNSSLRLSSGAITLKAGFTSIGGKAAFVLPSATAPLDKIESLHEIRLQLDPKQGAGG